MGLIISADASQEHGVITSYRCGGAHIDSTGVSPSRTPRFVIPVVVPLEVRLDSDQNPISVDVRPYSGAGMAGSFFMWPEELPGGTVTVDKFEPAPSSSFQYLPPRAARRVLPGNRGNLGGTHRRVLRRKFHHRVMRKDAAPVRGTVEDSMSLGAGGVARKAVAVRRQ